MTKAITVSDPVTPKFARGGPRLRRVVRISWDKFESVLAPHRRGRVALRAISTLAIRAQYGERCDISHVDGAWEYRWPDATVVSPRVILQWARPEQFGLQVNETLESSYCFEYLPGPGDVVLNVGAGVGCELFAFCRLVGPSGRVFAFEAHPATFGLMTRAATANNWKNAELVNVAVMDKSGSVMISDDQNYTVRSVLGSSPEIEIRAVSIDDFVELHGIQRVDFLVMNIEGAERLAIRGLERTFDKIQHICICCHDFINDPHKATKTEVVSWLEQHGFAVSTQPTSPWASVRDYVYGARTAG
jgi:FkbM family methyltransferase